MYNIANMSIVLAGIFDIKKDMWLSLIPTTIEYPFRKLEGCNPY